MTAEIIGCETGEVNPSCEYGDAPSGDAPHELDRWSWVRAYRVKGGWAYWCRHSGPVYTCLPRTSDPSCCCPDWHRRRKAIGEECKHLRWLRHEIKGLLMAEKWLLGSMVGVGQEVVECPACGGKRCEECGMGWVSPEKRDAIWRAIFD